MSVIIPKTEWIRTWSENGVGWIELCHENKLNPLSSAFILAIKNAAQKYDNDSSIGCIVLTGSEKAFAAGADLKEMVKLNYASVSESRYIENGWLSKEEIWSAIKAFRMYQKSADLDAVNEMFDLIEKKFGQKEEV